MSAKEPTWEEQAAAEILDMLRREGVTWVHPMLCKGLTPTELEHVKAKIRQVLRKYTVH